MKYVVRFAPSPTGDIHLGNIRAALLNYLFAKQKNGTFILRIEDTDQARSTNEFSLKIVKDLEWLGLRYDEGPFFQSQRIHIYQEQLNELIAQNRVYRCFCTPEELEEKRSIHAASGIAPRYDRTCLHLSDDHIKQKLVANKPFVWRFKINEDQVVSLKSIERKELRFEMKNFSDFTLTRSDGSFTFIFTNFVDDWLMGVNLVIRGEDHLSNTAMQAVLYDAFSVEAPTFWHLSMFCNAEGKKLSKRDFGFSLNDLRNEGFLPEAICNYLAVSGGGSFKNEVQSLDELVHNFNFESVHSTGAIRYDVEKLRWFNHKWIEKKDTKELLPIIVPFLNKEIHPSKECSEDRLLYLIGKVKNDCKTLKDFSGALKFCFEDPKIDLEKIDEYAGKDKTNLIATLIDEAIEYVPQRDLFFETVMREGKEKGLKPKEFLGVIRYILTGDFHGLGLHDVLEMLDDEQIKKRLRGL